MPPERVLVIKLGALGDMVQATGPFAAIRRHHPDAPLTLLTSGAFAELARASGWFDQVWLDDKPPWWRPGGRRRLARRVVEGGFERVYDLQTSSRSSAYFRLWPAAARPQWSGIAAGCSHPHANPARDSMHTLERQAEQLAMAGVAPVPAPDLSWLTGDAQRFGLPERFALVVAGGAPTRPAKRWPAAHYAALAGRLLETGLCPVLIGTGEDRAPIAAIVAAVPGARDLLGRTTLGDIAALARRAEVAVGNDTGPIHIAAVCGCRSVVLFGPESDPALCAPRGPDVTMLARPSLAALSVDTVFEAVSTGGRAA